MTLRSDTKNEQLKLSATFLNGLGIALFAVGGLAPIFSGLYGSSGLSITHGVVSAICAAITVALHLVARRILRGLGP